MSGPLIHVTLLVAIIVFGVVMAGFWNMTRRNASPSLSQTLMRWRVGLQFVAVAIAMLAFALSRA